MARVATRPLMTPSDLAGQISVPQATLAQWRHLGKGPRFLKLGRHVRYRHEDVAEWLEQAGQAVS